MVTSSADDVDCSGVVNPSSALMVAHTTLTWKVSKLCSTNCFSVKVLPWYACSKFRQIGHVHLCLESKYLRHIKYIRYMIFVVWAAIMQDIDVTSVLFSLWWAQCVFWGWQLYHKVIWKFVKFRRRLLSSVMINPHWNSLVGTAIFVSIPGFSALPVTMTTLSVNEAV